jgi:predicted ATPase
VAGRSRRADARLATVFTLSVDNLRALRSVRWSPHGISALVGPNGSGKTTLLLTLKLLRKMYDKGLDAGLRDVFGAPSELRTRGAHEGQVVSIGVELDSVRWSLDFPSMGPSAEGLSIERLRVDGDLRFEKALGKNLRVGGMTFQEDGRLAIRAVCDAPSELLPEAAVIGRFLQSLTAFHDPDMWHLRNHGSQRDQDRHLDSRGVNAFAMLHKWHGQKPHRHRYDFVVEGLRAAFPSSLGDLDFETAGNTIFVRTYAPGSEAPTPIKAEANGLIALLVVLCDLAGAEDGSVVAVDEPEIALHPFAIRELMRRARRWAQQHALTVIFSTHSPVLLDELTGDPTSVFVMQPDQAVLPVRLDALKNREWLAQFTYGELHTSGALASNDDPALPKAG